MASADTRTELLAVARATVQARGYNALSFRDLAAAVGVKSSSVHYYFPTKGDLAALLARQYTEEFLGYLDGLVAAGHDWAYSIGSYIDVFRATLLRENRMCLGGILAAEHHDLPPEVRREVEAFNRGMVGWLAQVVATGLPALDADAVRRRALAIFAGVEGAQLVARAHGDVQVFDDAIAAYRSAGLIP